MLVTDKLNEHLSCLVRYVPCCSPFSRRCCASGGSKAGLPVCCVWFAPRGEVCCPMVTGDTPTIRLAISLNVTGMLMSWLFGVIPGVAGPLANGSVLISAEVLGWKFSL